MRFLPLATAAVLLVSALEANAPVAPRKSPEFVLTFNDGSQKLLSAYRGKVVMLAFIQTTCPHCQHACEVISKLNTEFAPKGFQPVAVAWNEMAKMFIPDFIKQHGVNFPLAFGERDPVLNYLGYSPMERVVVPQVVWIDRKGVIRAQTTAGGEDPKALQEDTWRTMINTLTAEPDGAVKKTAHAAATHKQAAR